MSIPYRIPSRVVHRLFAITIVAKGISSFFEILFGLLFLWLSPAVVSRVIFSLASQEVFAAKGSMAGSYLMHHAREFSVNTQHFITAYLLFYGAVNIFLVASLLKKKMWAYPAAIFFFLSFTAYMIWRFSVTQSGILLAFIIFDLCLIGLTVLEYKRLAGILPGASPIDKSNL